MSAHILAQLVSLPFLLCLTFIKECTCEKGKTFFPELKEGGWLICPGLFFPRRFQFTSSFSFSLLLPLLLMLIDFDGVNKTNDEGRLKKKKSRNFGSSKMIFPLTLALRKDNFGKKIYPSKHNGGRGFFLSSHYFLRSKCRPRALRKKKTFVTFSREFFFE